MENLPLEIRKLIASFTSNVTKRQLRLTNTIWLKITDYNFTIYLTKGNLSEWKQIVDTLERSNRPISLHLAEDIDTSKILNEVPRLSNMIEMRIDDCQFYSYFQSNFDRLTVLTNLQVLEGILSAPIFYYTKFGQLRVLKYSSYRSTKDSEVADALRILTNLEEFGATTDTGNTEKDPFYFINDANTKLTKLLLTGFSVQKFDEQHFQKLFRIKSFSLTKPRTEQLPIVPLKYLTALEELDSELPISDLNSTRLTKFSCSNNLKQYLELPYMESIKDLSSVGERTMPYLERLTDLESLHILGLPKEDAQFSFLGNIQSSKFKYLRVAGRQRRIDFDYLSRLDSITGLSLSDVILDDNITLLTNLVDMRYWYNSPFRQMASSLITNDSRKHVVNLNLPNLECLMMQIEDGDIFGLQSMTKLTALHLYVKERTTFPNLEMLTNLQIFHCDVKSDNFDFLTALINLRNLYLPHLNHTTELSYLTSMTRLTKLVLDALYRKKDSLKVTREAQAMCLTSLTSLQIIKWYQLPTSVESALKLKLKKFVEVIRHVAGFTYVNSNTNS